MNISSFEQLAEHIRTFENWGGDGAYDFGGVVYLLEACLDNIQKNATDHDIEDIAERLNPSNIDFLINLSKILSS